METKIGTTRRLEAGALEGRDVGRTRVLLWRWVVLCAHSVHGNDAKTAAQWWRKCGDGLGAPPSVRAARLGPGSAGGRAARAVRRSLVGVLLSDVDRELLGRVGPELGCPGPLIRVLGPLVGILGPALSRLRPRLGGVRPPRRRAGFRPPRTVGVAPPGVLRRRDAPAQPRGERPLPLRPAAAGRRRGHRRRLEGLRRRRSAFGHAGRCPGLSRLPHRGVAGLARLLGVLVCPRLRARARRSRSAASSAYWRACVVSSSAAPARRSAAPGPVARRRAPLPPRPGPAGRREARPGPARRPALRGWPWRWPLPPGPRRPRVLPPARRWRRWRCGPPPLLPPAVAVRQLRLHDLEVGGLGQPAASRGRDALEVAQEPRPCG